MKLKDFVFNSLRVRGRRKKPAPSDNLVEQHISTSCFGLEKNRKWFSSATSRSKSRERFFERNDQNETNWQGNALYTDFVTSKKEDRSSKKTRSGNTSNVVELSSYVLEEVSSLPMTSHDYEYQINISDNDASSMSSICEMNAQSLISFNNLNHVHVPSNHSLKSYNHVNNNSSQKCQKLSENFTKKSQAPTKPNRNFFRKSISSFQDLRKQGSKKVNPHEKQTRTDQDAYFAHSVSEVKPIRNEIATTDHTHSTKAKKKTLKGFPKFRRKKEWPIPSKSFENLWVMDIDSNNTVTPTKDKEGLHVVTPMPSAGSYIRESSIESCPSPRPFDFQENCSMRDLDIANFESASLTSYESDLSRGKLHRPRSRIKTNPWLPSPRPSLSLGSQYDDYDFRESKENIRFLEEHQLFSRNYSLYQFSDDTSPFDKRTLKDANSNICRSQSHRSLLSNKGSLGQNLESPTLPTLINRLDAQLPKDDIGSQDVASKEATFNDLNMAASKPRPASIVSPNTEFVRLADHLEQLANNLSFEFENVQDTTIDNLSFGRKDMLDATMGSQMSVSEPNIQVFKQNIPLENKYNSEKFQALKSEANFYSENGSATNYKLDSLSHYCSEANTSQISSLYNDHVAKLQTEKSRNSRPATLITGERVDSHVQPSSCFLYETGNKIEVDSDVLPKYQKEPAKHLASYCSNSFENTICRMPSESSLASEDTFDSREHMAYRTSLQCSMKKRPTILDMPKIFNNMEKTSLQAEPVRYWTEELDFPRNITVSECLESPTENWQWGDHCSLWSSPSSPCVDRHFLQGAIGGSGELGEESLVDDCHCMDLHINEGVSESCSRCYGLGLSNEITENGNQCFQFEELVVKLIDSRRSMTPQSRRNDLNSDSVHVGSLNIDRHNSADTSFDTSDACVQTDFEDDFLGWDEEDLYNDPEYQHNIRESNAHMTSNGSLSWLVSENTQDASYSSWYTFKKDDIGFLKEDRFYQFGTNQELTMSRSRSCEGTSPEIKHSDFMLPFEISFDEDSCDLLSINSHDSPSINESLWIMESSGNEELQHNMKWEQPSPLKNQVPHGTPLTHLCETDPELNSMTAITENTVNMLFRDIEMQFEEIFRQLSDSVGTKLISKSKVSTENGPSLSLESTAQNIKTSFPGEIKDLEVYETIETYRLKSDKANEKGDLCKLNNPSPSLSLDNLFPFEQKRYDENITGLSEKDTNGNFVDSPSKRKLVCQSFQHVSSSTINSFHNNVIS